MGISKSRILTVVSEQIVQSSAIKKQVNTISSVLVAPVKGVDYFSGLIVVTEPNLGNTQARCTL